MADQLTQALAVLPARPSRAQIERLELELLRMEGAGHGDELPTWHHFADGLAARTILIKAGTCLTGAAHKSEHLNVCCGDITVWTEDGMRRLTGYHVLSSRPGAKRVGLAHDDTWWTTVHANPDNVTDVAVLEELFVEEASRLQSRRLLARDNLKEIAS